jgi:hypothetical protein
VKFDGRATDWIIQFGAAEFARAEDANKQTTHSVIVAATTVRILSDSGEELGLINVDPCASREPSWRATSVRIVSSPALRNCVASSPLCVCRL